MITRHIFPRSEVVQKTADFVFGALESYLAKGPTLLLLSGGSVGREVAPRVVDRLSRLAKANLEKLHVGLVDERLGPPEAAASNLRLLKEAGVIARIRTLGSHLHVPLLEKERAEDPYATGRFYQNRLVDLGELCADRSVGVFGVGEDGHTAGILGARESVFKKIFTKDKPVVVYRAPDFLRLTITPSAFLKLGQIVIYATGEKKRGALEQLLFARKDLGYVYPVVFLQPHPSTQLFTDIEVGYAGMELYKTKKYYHKKTGAGAQQSRT